MAPAATAAAPPRLQPLYLDAVGGEGAGEKLFDEKAVFVVRVVAKVERGVGAGVVAGDSALAVDVLDRVTVKEALGRPVRLFLFAVGDNREQGCEQGCEQRRAAPG